MFAEQLWTGELRIPEVADRIAASSGLPLSPNTDWAEAHPLRLTQAARKAKIGYDTPRESGTANAPANRQLSSDLSPWCGDT